MEGDDFHLNTTVIPPNTRKNINIDRVLTLGRGSCLLLLLRYRFNNPLQGLFLIWAIAGFCECLFVLNFIVYSLLKWRPVERQTCPHTLSARYEKPGEACKLYPIDIFITTADPQKEPPLITANTILSVLAVGYPADRVSCYVSDDSASPLIFCMMLEVFIFAHKWMPFCKSHSVEPRSPAKFFNSPSASLSEQGNKLKEEYEQLEKRVNDLAQRPQEALKIARRFTCWASDNPHDHPPIVEVLNNIEIGRSEWNAPLLVYVAREKRKGYKHEFKAGALNALMRVSGVLSNSPFILNLDCDTYINDSNALKHAMCFFMDTKLGENVGFVQFPQVFDNLDRQDVHGNRLVYLYNVLLKGLDGIQGPYYCGTGCFLRRTALQGVETQQRSLLEDCKCSSGLGSSLELGKSALTKHVTKEMALDLCSCNHEKGTAWGKQVGWKYGSSTEDVLTGYGIHCLGWRSIYLWLAPPAFKGIAPSASLDRLAQRKRIAAGLVSILLMPSSSLLYSRKTRLMLLQRIAYIYDCMFYAGISVFVLLYMVLHVACLLLSKSLAPKVREYEAMWFVGALCFQHGTSFLEYKWGVRNERFGVREWWNEERFWFLSNVSCFVLGTLEALLKSVGLVGSSFTITPKTSSPKSELGSEAPYASNASLLFTLPMTLVMFILLAMMSTTFYVIREGVEALDYMGGELLFGIWSLFILYPIVRQIIRVLKGFKVSPWLYGHKNALPLYCFFKLF